MRVHYQHPVQLSNKEERKLLSSFYRQMQRQPREAVPLHLKALELTPEQRERREADLIVFLKFGPWQEEIRAAGRLRAGSGREARNIGIGIAACGAAACFVNPLLGVGMIVAGGAVCIAGAMMMGRHTEAAEAWEKVKKSAEARLAG